MAPAGSLLAVAIALAVVGGCSSSAVGPVRFHNAAPVWHVNDRLDTPEPPEARPFLRVFYHFNSYYLRATRGLNLTRLDRAGAVNSLDEVPNSTWFTNRVGDKVLTPKQIEHGPGSAESPELNLPWTIESAKAGGASVGFVCVDATGTKFVLKFDEVGFPEFETAADVVVSRLYWAAGWNVTSDHIVDFKRADLKIGPKATRKVKGEKVALDEAFVDQQLKLVNVAEDGTIRGLAPLFVEGKPLGGMPRLGVREDDPNDRVPHELRRDQRGQAALAAWLAVTDAKEDQTIDTWVEDPADKQRHYVKHYLIDFGKSMGAYPRIHHMPQADRTYQLDFKELMKSLLSLGIYRQPWEGRVDPHVPGIGMFASEDFDPDGWKPMPMGQFPILWADRFDQFWGTKLIARLTREQIAGAVASAKYTDPAAAPYLLDTLVKRQRRSMTHWFRQVLPVDEPAIAVTGGAYRLCFTDLAVRYQTEPDATVYRARAYDRHGASLGAIEPSTTDAAGKTCLAALPMAIDGDRYTIYEITGSRGIPGTSIHLAIDPASGAPHVVGMYRR